jgi:hypothetical protein
MVQAIRMDHKYKDDISTGALNGLLHFDGEPMKKLLVQPPHHKIRKGRNIWADKMLGSNDALTFQTTYTQWLKSGSQTLDDIIKFYVFKDTDGIQATKIQTGTGWLTDQMKIIFKKKDKIFPNEMVTYIATVNAIQKRHLDQNGSGK